MLGSWALEVGVGLQSGRLDTEPRARGLDGQTPGNKLWNSGGQRRGKWGWGRVVFKGYKVSIR